MNILQFYYSPKIMQPFFEVEHPDELFNTSVPRLEEPKSKVEMRYLSELQYYLYRSGMVKLNAETHSFVDGLGLNFLFLSKFYSFLGYVDEMCEERVSALSDFYIDMFQDLASEFNEASVFATNDSIDKKWW